MLSLLLVALCLATVIAIYFYNNPMGHGRWFMMRRFINWLPLGLTYSFLYMGRYNLTVSKDALGSLMPNQDFGVIFTAGTWTYALAFLINGPIVDRIGGKKGILIAACGSAAANLMLGVLTYLLVMGRLKANMVVTFSLLSSVNMFFQSYGAMSIIKVKAYWFHVRERGIFGAVFGTLISIGIYFAFDWGSAILRMTKANPDANAGWFAGLLRRTFASHTASVDAIWAVFYLPAVIMIFWVVMDIWLIKDTPEEAGFPHLDTHDASSGVMHVELTTMDLLKKVFASRLMLMLAAVELTAGVLRDGIYVWFRSYAKLVSPAAAPFTNHWGLLLCIFGIVGGFAGGLISDRFFHSRRGPPAVLFCAFMFVMAGVIAVFLFSAPLVVGSAAVLIAMAVIGVHSLMSGTAAADFGGRKATATCSGIVDGFVYLGSGLQALCLGFLTRESWYWWPIFLMPFALLGGFMAWQIWHELPAATRKYIAEVERKPKPATPAETIGEML